MILVTQENVTPLWPQVGPVLAPAIALRPTHDAEDVRLLLMDRRCHLWVQWESEMVIAAAVTEFATYPKGSWLRVWMMGAIKGADTDYDDWLATLDRWRVLHKCRGFEAIGRHGWLRKFPAQVEGIVMRYTVE